MLVTKYLHLVSISWSSILQQSNFTGAERGVAVLFFPLSHFTKTSPGPVEWGANHAASTPGPSIVRILRTPSSD
ncbi:hypothetical protein CDEST_03516 [Colletotrichum destructivum]|uniref:Secreted protein n=1 Tax=Colletotrichum destructivum TaxID=34406 RepID=A0AAX4I545_9PEZI|nr:hypothetical protein CDEST_03516 [Colletotrichum destructivum]